MAPIAPPKAKTSLGKESGSGAKRLTARQKAALRLTNPLIPRKVHRPEAQVSDSINSKRDKRLIKHSSFVSRITKDSDTKKKLKRRRPSKKLVATLESLGDALDDIVSGDKDKAGGQGLMDTEQALQGKIRHKSLRSRPGALKRKEKVVKGEMERFGRSLAQLAAIPPSTTSASGNAEAENGGAQTQQQQDGGSGMEVKETGKAETTQAQTQAIAATSNRWAALRGFISATMEQNPAFLQQQQK